MKNEIGIDAVRTKERRIRLKTKSIPFFINYIGRKPSLSCYAYKFDVPEWRFWKPMKEVAKELSIPYGRLSYLVKIGAIKYYRSPGGKKVMFSQKQIDELISLNKLNMLTADARMSNTAISKGKFNKVPLNLQNELEELRGNGFPYTEMKDERISYSFNHLKNVPCIHINGRDFSANYRNNELAITHHPHMYGVSCGGDKSPLEAFSDDEIMCKIIEENKRKNVPITRNNLLSKICHYGGVKRTSVFPVRVAKTLISRFGFDDMKILDPCAGYSSRLIGFMAQGYSGSYVGIDPCKNTVDGLLKTRDKLTQFDNVDHKADIIMGCAETQMKKFDSDSFDIVFTSPPYFDLEKYDTDESQSYKKYPHYEQWKNKFLFEIIKESKRIMKKDGIFLLNVGNPRNYNLVDDVDKFTRSLFRVENVLLMHSPSVWHDAITEPIFCLKKN